VVSETIVDVIECTHSIPHCTTIMSVQSSEPLYWTNVGNRVMIQGLGGKFGFSQGLNKQTR